MIEHEKLEKLREEVRSYYFSLKEVYCPYFKDKVIFASDGFQHMLHKGPENSTRRTSEDQYMRLKLFKLVPDLLKDSKTVQEHQLKKVFIPVTHNGRREKVLKDAHYWAFIGVIKDRRLKVVVKQDGNGVKRFCSIVPKWRIRKSPDSDSKQIINYISDLEGL